MRVLILLICCCGPLAASGLDFELPSPRTSGLFQHASFGGADLRIDDFRRAQLIDDSGPSSDQLLFGAGASLGLASNPIGAGFQGWFDVYPVTFLAIGVNTFFNYGVLTDKRRDGGTGLATGFTVGGKFVLDLPGLELSRWFRPYVMFHPAGLLYFAGDEEFRDADDRKRRVQYDDVFYVMQGGAGVDFFLTSYFAVGAGVYFRGTFGGSKHVKDNVTIRTRGRTGLYFEYARATIRF